MYWTEEATNKLIEMAEKQKRKENGIRIIAQPDDEEGFTYELYWEHQVMPTDETIKREGLNIFIDKQSHQLLEDTVVYFTIQEGKEGIFIMKTTSDCSTCSTVCF